MRTATNPCGEDAKAAFERTGTTRDATTGDEAPPSSPEDAVVIAQILDGDRDRFSILMRRHNRRLFRVARAILGNDAEAQDVVQQSYVNAYAHLGQFAASAAFSTWLTRIAINEALARLRCAMRTRGFSPDAPGLEWCAASLPPTPEDDVSRRELALLLEAAIDRLPRPCRIALVLREMEGLSTGEIAVCLGISEEAVRTRLHRTRALLREELAERIGTEAEEVFPFGGARCDAIVGRVLAALRERSE